MKEINFYIEDTDGYIYRVSSFKTPSTTGTLDELGPIRALNWSRKLIESPLEGFYIGAFRPAQLRKIWYEEDI